MILNFVVLYSLIVAISPRRPSCSNIKGKKIAKPRRQPHYVIRVLDQIPHSTPIQAPTSVGVPTPHLTEVLIPHPTVVPTPHPTVVPIPSTSTPQPSNNLKN